MTYPGASPKRHIPSPSDDDMPISTTPAESKKSRRKKKKKQSTNGNDSLATADMGNDDATVVTTSGPELERLTKDVAFGSHMAAVPSDIADNAARAATSGSEPKPREERVAFGDPQAWGGQTPEMQTNERPNSIFGSDLSFLQSRKGNTTTPEMPPFASASSTKQFIYVPTGSKAFYPTANSYTNPGHTAAFRPWPSAHHPSAIHGPAPKSDTDSAADFVTGLALNLVIDRVSEPITEPAAKLVTEPTEMMVLA